MTTLFDQTETTEAATMASTELVEHVDDAAPNVPASLISQAIAAGIPLGELREYAKECEASAAADAFGHALAGFQAACPQIKKNRQIDLGGGKGPQFASYDDIDEVIRPFMAQFGLAKTFSANLTEAGQMRVVCKIRHGRHVEENEVTLPVPTQMRVNDTQKMGAALQYGKRYALCAALDIVVTDEDRDGEGLVEHIDEAQIATLREWIVSTDANEKGFLKFMGVDSLASIGVGDFAKALDALKRKAKK